jgi:DNA-binding response OmpR family regulator
MSGALYSGTPIDIILAEPQFPGVTKFEVLQEIYRESFRENLPIFIMSYNLTKIEMLSMIRWGVVGYISKPCNVNAIGNLIFSYLQSKSSEEVFEIEKLATLGKTNL